MAAGFGLGLVTDGDVYRGSSSNVGEIGHMVLDVNGPECWCGSRGCLESLAAPAAVVKRAEQDEALVNELALRGRQLAVRSDFAKIARLAAAGDPRCCAADRGVRDVPGEGARCRSRTCSTSTRSSSRVPASARPAASTSGSRRPRSTGCRSSARCTRPGSNCPNGAQRRRPRRRVPRPPQPANPHRPATTVAGCRVSRQEVLQPEAALLHGPLLGRVVDVDDPEASAVAPRPFEVVHQRPGEVPLQWEALGDDSGHAAVCS